jgi:hypothetical protein
MCFDIVIAEINQNEDNYLNIDILLISSVVAKTDALVK